VTQTVAFSEEWAQAWCRALNGSEAYRHAAARWEGPVGLVMTTPTGESRAVFLDLWHGECRSARIGQADEVHAAASYVISAARDTWQDLLSARTSPLLALMTGKLKLTKGDMAALLPYAGAAKELVSTVTMVDTVFPEDAA
jgi:putative sterol carrier protein